MWFRLKISIWIFWCFFLNKPHVYTFHLHDHKAFSADRSRHILIALNGSWLAQQQYTGVTAEWRWIALLSVCLWLLFFLGLWFLSDTENLVTVQMKCKLCGLLRTTCEISNLIQIYSKLILSKVGSMQNQHIRSVPQVKCSISNFAIPHWIT